MNFKFDKRMCSVVNSFIFSLRATLSNKLSHTIVGNQNLFSPCKGYDKKISVPFSHLFQFSYIRKITGIQKTNLESNGITRYVEEDFILEIL